MHPEVTFGDPPPDGMPAEAEMIVVGQEITVGNAILSATTSVVITQPFLLWGNSLRARALQ